MDRRVLADAEDASLEELQTAERILEELMTLENEIYNVGGYEPEFVKEVFEYLDFLRETGATNMFGASPFVQHEFDLDRKDAKAFLMKWMDTFAQRQEA